MQKHTRTSFATPETKPNTTSFPWMGFGLALFLALLAGSNASANEPWLPQSYFGGITSDLQGNLVVDRETQASTTYLEKLSITGSQLSSVYGFPTARLATDPASGLIFALESNGKLLLVTPDASSGAEFLDLTTQNYEPGNPLDVSNGNRATASIDPRSAVYEDIALLRTTGLELVGGEHSRCDCGSGWTGGSLLSRLQRGCNPRGRGRQSAVHRSTTKD